MFEQRVTELENKAKPKFKNIDEKELQVMRQRKWQNDYFPYCFNMMLTIDCSVDKVE